MIPGCGSSYYGVVAMILSTLSGAGCLLVAYGYWYELLNPYDYIDYLCLIFGRSIIIASKYAFFRPRHTYLLRNAFTPVAITEHDLVMKNEMVDPDYHQEKILLHLRQIQMHPG